MTDSSILEIGTCPANVPYGTQDGPLRHERDADCVDAIKSARKRCLSIGAAPGWSRAKDQRYAQHQYEWESERQSRLDEDMALIREGASSQSLERYWRMRRVKAAVRSWFLRRLFRYWVKEAPGGCMVERTRFWERPAA